MVGYRVCRANAHVERLLGQEGIEPHFVMRAEDNRLLQGLVARGVGAAIMPLLALDTDRPETLMIDMRSALPDRRTGLVWHRAAPMQAFAEIAQAVAAQLAAELRLTPITPTPG